MDPDITTTIRSVYVSIWLQDDGFVATDEDGNQYYGDQTDEDAILDEIAREMRFFEVGVNPEELEEIAMEVATGWDD